MPHEQKVVPQFTDKIITGDPKPTNEAVVNGTGPHRIATGATLQNDVLASPGEHLEFVCE